MRTNRADATDARTKIRGINILTHTRVGTTRIVELKTCGIHPNRMLSFVSSQAIIRVTDVADGEPSPPLEVDMRTFSELARAHPLEHSLVMGGKENFRVNGLDGEHQPAGRRSNAPARSSELSPHCAASCR